MRIFKFLRNNKLRKPRNFVPITWSIPQGPRISGEGIAIRIEIGDRDGEATSYGNLRTLFHSLGQYDKARDYEGK